MIAHRKMLNLFIKFDNCQPMIWKTLGKIEYHLYFDAIYSSFYDIILNMLYVIFF